MSTDIERPCINCGKPDGDEDHECIKWLKAEVARWKDIAEECAVAQTKTEACEIFEKALSA